MKSESVKTGWWRRGISKIVNSMHLLPGVGLRHSREFIRKYRITGHVSGALRILKLFPNFSPGEFSGCKYLHFGNLSEIVDRLGKKGYDAREQAAGIIG
jgi:hypothetical protein